MAAVQVQQQIGGQQRAIDGEHQAHASLHRVTRQGKQHMLALGEIALQTGWCDQSAFTRHFSRYAGMAPGKFRAMQGTK